MKIPQLRNLYQKVGMFGFNTQVEGTPHAGDQIRGFGFDNAGASGTLDTFLQSTVFTLDAAQRAQVAQFLFAYPSDLLPIVGQQLTVTAANAGRGDVQARLTLLLQRAAVTSPRPECELVVRGALSGRAMGWVMSSGQRFVPNIEGETPLTLQELLMQASAAGAPLTFTC